MELCCKAVKGECFTDYAEALQQFKPDMVLICTPPVLHIEQAVEAVQAGAHVFIEKPLSHESSGIQLLDSKRAATGEMCRSATTCVFIQACRF